MLATKYNLGAGANLGTMLSDVNSDYDKNLLQCGVAEGCVDTVVNGNGLVGTPLNIIKMGIPGLNLTFSKPVSIIIGVDPEYLGSTFVVQTFDIENSVWVDHGSCTVKMIIPPSTEHGGDQYGVTRPIAYAGCEFTTDHASFFSANVLGAETENAGVPKAGVGGTSLYWFEKYF